MKYIINLSLFSFVFFISLYSYSQTNEDLFGQNNYPKGNVGANTGNDNKALTTADQLSQTTTGMPKTAPSYNNINRQGIMLPGETSIEKLLPIPEIGLAPPFGANIFSGGYESERVDGLSDDYLIASGDKISIWIWGGITFSDITTVDNQGNIFIPNIGPIKVANVNASEVNNVVTNKIKTIYKRNVDVYVNLLTATPAT